MSTTNIELTDEKGNKAKFTISFTNISIAPAPPVVTPPAPEPTPTPPQSQPQPPSTPPAAVVIDAPVQPKTGGRVIQMNKTAASTSQLFQAEDWQIACGVGRCLSDYTEHSGGDIFVEATLTGNDLEMFAY